MKTRNGLVSNSSSSSFIISCDNKKTKSIIPVEVDLLDCGTVIKNEEDLNEFFENTWNYKHLVDKNKYENSWEQKNYEACLKEIENGRTIVVGEIDHHGTDIIKLLLYNKIGPLPKEFNLILDPS